MTSKENLATAMTAAQIGGRVVRSFFREMRPSEVSEKARNDWVSSADRASETAIIAYLREQTPDLGVLAEEGGASGGQASRWVIDPLDGTFNFIRGLPHFAVSVALVSPSGVECGAIFDPMRDELFAASHGGGAFRDGSRLAVTGRPDLGGAFVTTGFPYRVHRYIDTYLAIFRDVFFEVGALRRPGAAALDLAHTAAGIFDAFFEFCLSPWDLAAGLLLVREAGGVVSDLDGNDDVLARGNVVAATPGVHRGLLEIIQRHCRERDIVP